MWKANLYAMYEIASFDTPFLRLNLFAAM